MRIDGWVNMLSVVSEVILGVFVIVGGLIFVNFYRMRQEAKEELKQIKQIRAQADKISAMIYAIQDKEIERIMKFTDDVLAQVSKVDKTFQDKLSEWNIMKVELNKEKQRAIMRALKARAEGKQREED